VDEPGTEPRAARISLGFVLTPPAAALATLVYGSMLGVIADVTGLPIPGAVPLPVAIGLGIYVFVLAVPVTGLVAFPVFDHLRKRRRVTVARAVATGACCSIGAYLMIMLWIFVIQGAQTSWRSQIESGLQFYSVLRLAGFLLLMAAIGATAAASFWLIAVRGTTLAVSREP
jgi:hypothetical protein